MQKGGFLGGTPVHLHDRNHGAQGLLQQEQLASGVQGHPGKTAGNGQHPVTEPPEAEHFGVAAGSIPTNAAQVDLRLVGCMLRHQQDLLAGIPQVRDAVEYGI